MTAAQGSALGSAKRSVAHGHLWAHLQEYLHAFLSEMQTWQRRWHQGTLWKASMRLPLRIQLMWMDLVVPIHVRLRIQPTHHTAADGASAVPTHNWHQHSQRQFRKGQSGCGFAGRRKQQLRPYPTYTHFLPVMLYTLGPQLCYNPI